MQILEAFRALRALDEDVFDVSDINKLSDFMDSDDLDYGVEVIDPEANTAEDIQDSYVGKVILDCCVCHSKLYRDKEDVVLDETGELANVGEDCPYCFTPDGFKVIGEVAAYSDAPAEEEPADADNSDDVEVEDEVEAEEEVVEKKSSRNESVNRSRRTALTEDVEPPKLVQSEIDAIEKIVMDEIYKCKVDYFDTKTKKHSTLPLSKFEIDSDKGATVTHDYKGRGVTIRNDGIFFKGHPDIDGEELASLSDKVKDIINDKYGNVCVGCKISHGGKYNPIPYSVKYYIYLNGDYKHKMEVDQEVEDTGATKLAGELVPGDKVVQYGKIKSVDADGNMIIVDFGENGKHKYKSGEKVHVYESFAMGRHSRYSRRMKESTTNGTAEGGFLDTAKRPGGHTKGSGTNFKALDGKKTKTVRAKDLKPGMVTDTGKITKVTDIGWHNGKPSVEVAYGGIGAGGSFASDRVAADRDYEVLDEGIFDKLKKKKKPDFYSKEEIEKRRKANEDRLQKEKEKKEEEERKRGAEIAADWARRDKMKRDAERDYKRSLSTGIKGDSPSNTGHRGVSYSGGDYYPESLDPINESINSLSLDTDDTHMEMTSDESGKVTVTTEPITSGVDSEEMIAPVSDETVAEIEANTEEAEMENSEDVPVEEPSEEVAPEEEVDMEIEEVDDDTLGVHESYLRNVYENVKSYKTTGVTIRGNEMIVEGKIKFDNNHVKKVNFVYEAFSTDGKGNVTFKGSNEIAKKRGSYTLSGMVKDNKLVLESLSYNYNTLNEGKTRRVRGTVRV